VNRQVDLTKLTLTFNVQFYTPVFNLGWQTTDHYNVFVSYAVPIFEYSCHQIFESYFRTNLPALDNIWNQDHAFYYWKLAFLHGKVYQQEAPLTLRGQRGRCRNIKGDLQIFGSFPRPRLRLLFLWVWFFGGSWQTQVVHQIWCR